MTKNHKIQTALVKKLLKLIIKILKKVIKN